MAIKFKIIERVEPEVVVEELKSFMLRRYWMANNRWTP
jgi:hypothetical protein